MADKVGKWLWYHKFKTDTDHIFVPHSFVSSPEISMSLQGTVVINPADEGYASGGMESSWFYARSSTFYES